MFIISTKIKIPYSEFEFSFVRSSGPGGQNVNKVSSKAVLRWNPIKSTSLPTDVRFRFLQHYGNRLTKDGDLIITSDRLRDQIRNQDDCLSRLRIMLLSIADPPKPRLKTKIGYFTKQRAIEKKRAHGERKKSRQKPDY